jgi:ribosomal protein S18 acetylase RimI-like enzyme
MLDEPQTQAPFIIRRASPDDYPAFVRLFPELLVDDPVPSLDTWTSVLAPSTLIAARDGEVLGYCFFQEYTETGYVRNVVVAPIARRGGVGRALMHATAEHLRSRGKGSWRLNVKPSNQAARALYEQMGMRAKYAAKALRLPWAAAKALPEGSAVVRELTPDRDAALESLFDLPRGQLAAARAVQRLLFEAISSDGRASVGLAVFDPKFPGAFPFRVTEVGAVTSLLTAMRRHVPMDEYVNLAAEDDERLADLLASVGASLRDEILHMEGAL